jgi:hypothetical protein
MQLTNNFSLKELTVSDVAVRKGIDNTPNDECIANLKLLAENILQPIREFYEKPVKVNSAYRSPDVNTAVGGSKTSDHCKGQAADIEIAGVDTADLANYIADTYKFTQIILEFYTPGVSDSGWVHVSYDPKNLKCETLTATKKDGKTVYLKGFVI